MTFFTEDELYITNPDTPDETSGWTYCYLDIQGKGPSSGIQKRLRFYLDDILSNYQYIGYQEVVGWNATGATFSTWNIAGILSPRDVLLGNVRLKFNMKSGNTNEVFVYAARIRWSCGGQYGTMPINMAITIGANWTAYGSTPYLDNWGQVTNYVTTTSGTTDCLFSFSPPSNHDDIKALLGYHKFISLTYTDTHPKERPDRFDATLSGYVTNIRFGDLVEVFNKGTVVWKGILEQIEYDIDDSGGCTTVIGGRDKSVILWRKYNNRFMIEDDSGSGEAIENGFFEKFYPHQLWKFLLYCPACDVSDYTLEEKGELYRVGQGLDYDNMSVIDTIPAEGDGGNMIDRDESTAWNSSSNIQSGHSFTIDLGGQVQNVMGAVFIGKSDGGGYPALFKIFTSTNDIDYTLRDTIYKNGAKTGIFSFSPVTCRYIKFVSGSGISETWGIYEVFIYQSLGNRWWVIGNNNPDWSLSLGTINTWASTVTGGLNLNYGRLSDGLKQLMTFANASDERWETWIDLDDEINFASRRGSDKSGTISFEFGVNIKKIKWKKDIANIILRLNVLGKDWSKEADGVDSGFATAGDAIVDLYGPYEKIIPPQPYPEQISAQLVRDVILIESQIPNEILTIVLYDNFDPNTYEAGDDVQVLCIQIGLNDAFRVKQRKVTIDGDSGKSVTLKLGESGKYRSYKDYMDRLAWMKKKIIETDFIIPW